MTVSVMWFRNDLRVSDNPALVQALRSSSAVVPLFVVDPSVDAGCPARWTFWAQCAAALDERLGGALVVRHGDPTDVVPAVAREVEATEVLCADDFTPNGMARDAAVEKALAAVGASLSRVGSPYAVPPGAVLKPDGSPYRVFTPYSRTWKAHGWPSPVPSPRSPIWASVQGRDLPKPPPVDATLPAPGEDAALRRLRHFLDGPVRDYARQRDLPAIGGTSRLSPYLHVGAIHPRQVLASVDPHGDGPRTFIDELCWREFSADVLFHAPRSLTESLDPRMSGLRWDDGAAAEERLAAWKEGRTGYPIVDAGMRQLLGEAWMHNRVRMIVGSFLTKDLHLPWQRGAQHFMDLLVDGDDAANSHNWQWVAGTGTDAAPFFRVFNPVTQGKKFDPDGSYVAKWVPELRDVPPKFRHEPWRSPDGAPEGYPLPIVDHDEERKEALARYGEVKS